VTDIHKDRNTTMKTRIFLVCAMALLPQAAASAAKAKP